MSKAKRAKKPQKSEPPEPTHTPDGRLIVASAVAQCGHTVHYTSRDMDRTAKRLAVIHEKLCPRCWVKEGRYEVRRARKMACGQPPDREVA